MGESRGFGNVAVAVRVIADHVANGGQYAAKLADIEPHKFDP